MKDGHWHAGVHAAPFARTMRRFASLSSIAKASWAHFKDADASLLAGAVSFFTFLSITPLAFASVVLVGWAVGLARARSEVLALVEDLLGPRGSDAARILIDDLPSEGQSLWLATAALVVALVGASRAFVHLQTALNRIFGVRTRRGDGLRGRARIAARKRGISIALALGFGAAVLVSALAGVALDALAGPSTPSGVIRIIETAVSLATMVCFLGLLYRYLPDVRLRWREAALGGVSAGLGVAVASKLLGAYLGLAVRSVSAAAAAIVVTLLWLQITGLRVLLGAAVVRAATEHAGLPIEPERHAVPASAS